MYERTWLEYYRKLRKLSRTELCDRSGISYSALQKYELGLKDLNNASYRTVVTMAEILDVTPADLVKEKTDA